MDELQGRIIRLRIYEEEGRTDWFLTFSKVMWFLIWFLFPLSLFRFIYDLMGAWEAIIGVLLFLIVFRIAGPTNLVMLDELLSRLSPSLRSAIRFGYVRIYDLRVRHDDGRELTCILRGDLVSGSPMRGDQVQLHGQMKHGAFIVRYGRNLTTDSVLTARPTYSLNIFIFTLGLAAFFSLYLLGTFDAWIYDWFIALTDMLTGQPSELNGE